MGKTPVIEEDETEGWSKWIWFLKKYRLTCCHCGLTHDFQTKIVKGKFYIRVRQNDRATVATRRQTEYIKK